VSTPRPVKYPLSNIDTSPKGVQPREKLNAETVAHYAELFRAGDTDFPPVYLWDIPGEGVRISDGYHRVNAAKAAGMKSIAAFIKEGTLADCVKDAAFRNACNGVQLTTGERKTALIRILEEHAKEDRNPGSLRNLADTVGLSHETVRKHKAEWDAAQARSGKPVGDFGDVNDEPLPGENRSILSEDDWANDDTVSEAEKAAIDRKAEMLVEIHDRQQFQKIALTKLGELRKLWRVEAEHPMGVHYVEYMPHLNKLIDFATEVVNKSCPDSLCDLCEGQGCNRCGGLGWLCKANKAT